MMDENKIRQFTNTLDNARLLIERAKHNIFLEDSDFYWLERCQRLIDELGNFIYDVECDCL